MKIVICGTGQLEILELIDSINKEKANQEKYQLIGFLDDNLDNYSRNLYGYKILGGFDWISNYKNEVFVVNSIARSTKIRMKANLKLEKLGAKFINLIHPSVQLSHSKSIGTGNIIFENTALKINSSIGNHNMILSGFVLGHDSQLGSYCFAGHNAICQGNVLINDCVFLASGCNIAPSLRVNNFSTIGIGSVLLRDAAEGYTYIGNPAKGILMNKNKLEK